MNELKYSAIEDERRFLVVHNDGKLSIKEIPKLI
jgi:hypothetical protein